MKVIAFIGLGANLEAPAENVKAAILRLDALPKTRVLEIAPLCRSKPLGPEDQPAHVNTVAKIETELEPLELLSALKGIEAEMGRIKTVRWGPRVIDLDILLYADRVVATDELQIPHKEIANRRFVLRPLFDLAPDLMIPGRKTVRALLEALGDESGPLTAL